MLLKQEKDIKEKKNIGYSKLEAYKKSRNVFLKILKSRKQLFIFMDKLFADKEKKVYEYLIRITNHQEILLKTLGAGDVCSLY